MCIAQKIQEKVDPMSWIMRKRGYAGATNPAAILGARTNKLLGIGSGKTETEKRAVRMGAENAEIIRQNNRSTAAPVHSKLIAGIGSRR